MRFAFLLILLFGGCAALAQDCTQTIPAIMLDEESGIFDPSITSGRLHAKLDGHLVPITSVERMTSFRVLILIDTSASMDPLTEPFRYQGKALALINKTLDELLGELPRGVLVEYGLFDKFAVFGPEFTVDAQELQRSRPALTERLKHRGLKTTALYDALEEGLARFDSPRPGDSIVMLTDGFDNKSHFKAEKVQEEATTKGVRLFTILLKGQIAAYDESGYGALFDFAERTGGSVHVIDAASRLWLVPEGPERESQDLKRFWNNEVISGYVLRFSPPAGLKKHTKWLLSVDRLPKQKHKVVASYPSRLNPCPAAVAALP
jgi:hypothetical protein